MDLFAALALQIIYGISNLVLISMGLAIIFGIIASTVFTLLLVPVVYLLVFDR